MQATYAVSLKNTHEGYAVSCPGLPECCSQGVTEPEALDNIREYLSGARELANEG